MIIEISHPDDNSFSAVTALGRRSVARVQNNRCKCLIHLFVGMFCFLLFCTVTVHVEAAVTKQPSTELISAYSLEQLWQTALAVCEKMGETVESENIQRKEIITRKRIYRENYLMKDWRHLLIIHFISSDEGITLSLTRKVQKAIRIYPRSEEDWYPASSDGTVEEAFFQLFHKLLHEIPPSIERKGSLKNSPQGTQSATMVASKPPPGSSKDLLSSETQEKEAQHDSGTTTQSYRQPKPSQHNPSPLDDEHHKQQREDEKSPDTKSEGSTEFESDESIFDEAVSGNLPQDNANKSPLAKLVSRLQLNGYARGDLFLGRNQETEDSEMKEAYGEVAFKLRIRKQKYGDAYGEIRIKAASEDDQYQTHFELREAYFNLYFSRYDVRIGHQIVTWGRADAINPTDNITPRDLRTFSPEVDDRRLANFGFRTNYNLTHSRVEMLWMPAFRASHYPKFAFPQNISFAEPQYPSNELSGGTGAVKLHLLYPSFEASLSYLYGQTLFPGLNFVEANLEDPTNPGLTLAWRSTAQQVVGADFSSTISPSIGVRGEAAYRRPVENSEYPWVPQPEADLVLGLEFTPTDNSSLSVQYVGRFIQDWVKLEKTGLIEENSPSLNTWYRYHTASSNTGISRSAASLPSDDIPPELMAQINKELDYQNMILWGQNEELMHGLTLHITASLLHQALQVEAFTLINATTEEWLLRPIISYDITDEVRITLGAELYDGPEETLFHLVRNTMSTLFFETKFSY